MPSNSFIPVLFCSETLWRICVAFYFISPSYFFHDRTWGNTHRLFKVQNMTYILHLRSCPKTSFAMQLNKDCPQSWSSWTICMILVIKYSASSGIEPLRVLEDLWWKTNTHFLLHYYLFSMNETHYICSLDLPKLEYKGILIHSTIVPTYCTSTLFLIGILSKSFPLFWK